MTGSEKLRKIVELMGQLDSREMGELSQIVKAELAARLNALVNGTKEHSDDRK